MTPKISIFFQVRYTGHRDLPMTERRVKFETEIQDGFAEIAISSTGLTLVLTWNWKKSKSYGCEFTKSITKVSFLQDLPSQIAKRQRSKLPSNDN